MSGNDENAEEVHNLLAEFDDALSTEHDAASRVSSAVNALDELGVDIDKERPGWQS